MLDERRETLNRLDMAIDHLKFCRSVAENAEPIRRTVSRDREELVSYEFCVAREVQRSLSAVLTGVCAILEGAVELASELDALQAKNT